jgi:hypothetical protein
MDCYDLLALRARRSHRRIYESSRFWRTRPPRPACLTKRGHTSVASNSSWIRPGTMSGPLHRNGEAELERREHVFARVEDSPQDESQLNREARQ